MELTNERKGRGSDFGCDACFASVQLKIEAGLRWWKDGFKARCYPGVTVAIRIPCLPHLSLTATGSSLLVQYRAGLLRKTIRVGLYSLVWRDLGFFNPRCVYIFIHPVSDSLCSAVLVPNSSLRHGQATGTHALVSPLLHSKWQSPTASASTYSDHRSEDYEEDACSEPSDGRSIGRCTASIMIDCMYGFEPIELLVYDI